MLKTLAFAADAFVGLYRLAENYREFLHRLLRVFGSPKAQKLDRDAVHGWSLRYEAGVGPTLSDISGVRNDGDRTGVGAGRFANNQPVIVELVLGNRPRFE